MSSLLIDVSEFQGIIDWYKVKKAGINYAMIRVGGRFGSSGKIYNDSKAELNLNNALANGIKVGAYFFTQAVNEREAVEEAEFTIKKLKGYDVTLPVAIDTEYLDGGRHNNLNRAQRTNVIKAFCDTIKNAGYTPMYYCSSSYLANDLESTKLSSYRLWLAQWSSKKPIGKYDIWQYSSSGRVSGINGEVDMNYLYEDYNASYPDDVKVKAVDVILGKYGNGDERVKKLGSSYNAVQSLVNKIYEKVGN